MFVIVSYWSSRKETDIGGLYFGIVYTAKVYMAKYEDDVHKSLILILPSICRQYRSSPFSVQSGVIYDMYYSLSNGARYIVWGTETMQPKQ